MGGAPVLSRGPALRVTLVGMATKITLVGGGTLRVEGDPVDVLAAFQNEGHQVAVFVPDDGREDVYINLANVAYWRLAPSREPKSV